MSNPSASLRNVQGLLTRADNQLAEANYGAAIDTILAALQELAGLPPAIKRVESTLEHLVPGIDRNIVSSDLGKGADRK